MGDKITQYKIQKQIECAGVQVENQIERELGDILKMAIKCIVNGMWQSTSVLKSLLTFSSSNRRIANWRTNVDTWKKTGDWIISSSLDIMLQSVKQFLFSTKQYSKQK